MITYLPFDSRLFVKKIGKIIPVKEYNEESLKTDVSRALEKYDCTYLELADRDKLNGICRKMKLYQAGTRLLMSKRMDNGQWSMVNGKKTEMLNQVQHDRLRNTLSACHPELVSGSKKFNNFLIDLAREIFKVSRFYTDPYFRKTGIRLYNLWVEKSFTGKYANKYFVEYEGDKPAGAITLREKSGDMFIDLFGVLEKFRNKGYGKKLLEKAICWSADSGYKFLNVYTQADNISAVSAYEKSGFVKKQIWNVYHLRGSRK